MSVVPTLNQVDLKNSWEMIDQSRETISIEIEKIAKNERGSSARQLKILSRWFKSSHKFEDALRRPDVLAVCLPLVKNSSDQSISEANIRTAARSGFSAMVHNSSLSQNLLRALLYPFAIFVCGVLLAIGFSCFVAPQFEQMYKEFGIALPAMTHWILDSASFLRRWSWVFVFWIFGGAALFWIFSHIEYKRRQSHMSWIDNRFLGSRDALASWAWHLSLLLEAGIAQPEAMLNAGYATGKAWLKQRSLAWAKQTNVNPEAKQSYLASRYRLLDHALTIPISDGKVQLLRKTATYYRSRNQNMGQWWISWLVLLIYWMIGFVVFICVISIFMPLIAIISGLTSNKW